MIESIVMSCDRGGCNYFGSTRFSLEAAGFSHQTQYDGYKSPDLHPSSTWTRIRIGIVPTFRIALSRILREPEPSRFIVFQDDILVAKGLHDWLEKNAPTEGVVSLYTAAPHDGRDGWRRLDLEPTEGNPYPWTNCLGACALMFTREIAERLLEEPPPVRTDRLGGWIGEWCYHNQIPFWVHSPSLVQHVGEVSVRGTPLTSDRVAARFCEDVSELENEVN